MRQMANLCEAFPSLRKEPGTNPFDVDAILRLACDQATPTLEASEVVAVLTGLGSLNNEGYDLLSAAQARHPDVLRVVFFGSDDSFSWTMQMSAGMIEMALQRPPDELSIQRVWAWAEDQLLWKSLLERAGRGQIASVKACGSVVVSAATHDISSRATAMVASTLRIDRNVGLLSAGLGAVPAWISPKQLGDLEWWFDVSDRRAHLRCGKSSCGRSLAQPQRHIGEHAR